MLRLFILPLRLKEILAFGMYITSYFYVPQYVYTQSLQCATHQRNLTKWTTTEQHLWYSTSNAHAVTQTCLISKTMWIVITTTPHHNRFTALFPGPPGWAGARRKLLDFMVQGKINRGRHTDNPAGRYSIRTNQCPPPSSPMFLQARCRSCRPTNSVKALKATVITIKTEKAKPQVSG